MISKADLTKRLKGAIAAGEAEQRANRPTLRRRGPGQATVSDALGNRAVGLYVALGIVESMPTKREPKAAPKAPRYRPRPHAAKRAKGT